MTSLVELSTDEEDSKVAEQLAGHGIGTDRELLLADDAVLERTNIPQSVDLPQIPPGPGDADTGRHWTHSVRMYYIRR